ncbi:MAG: class I SAM-dependent methyltransferase [Caulobacteraceae bacterium]|nr:class I SAM-dependent methyltransferase [Caulobacteraceae bacterium]
MNTAAPVIVTAGDRGPVWTWPEIRGAPAAFRAVLRLAGAHWREGSVAFVLPSGREVKVQGQACGPDARILVKDFRFIRRVMTAGDIGFAEGYMADEWDTPDLSAVLEAFSRNIDYIPRLIAGSWLSNAIGFVRHALNANSKAGSKRNIHAHYDLGNAFYSLWLDPSMTYSSAKFARKDEPLEAAQRRKYAGIAETMGLENGQSVLEIGCGWGGFAEFAAGEVGAKVTGITISKEQFEFARRRVFEKGLAEKADIQLIDYRDVRGRFDRVASIEMFEAVGEKYWPAYFGKISEVLSPGGRAALQIITIRDEFFEQYRKRTDFIQRFIFPGGMLPSETRLREETDRAGLSWTGLDRFAQSYADTLLEWQHRFDAAWRSIQPLGFDERFRRLWKFYLSYCEAGFRTERTNVIQLGLART